MKGSLKKLKKLRGRGLTELRVRGAQGLAALAERRGWSSLARVPSDAALFAMLDGAAARAARSSAEGLLEHFRARSSPRFFASFDDPAATAAEWWRRFGGGALDELVRRADRVAAGRFDLLGLRDLTFGGAAGVGACAAIDWHLEPRSGRRAPLAHWSRVEYLNPEAVGDKKITWELNRHQHFLVLGRAYLLTRDERYAGAFAAQLLSWIEANPPKLGINWASSLEVAFRSISWLWALHFFKDSPRLTPELFSRALKLLVLHARHVETYLSTYFSPNTHLTGEALGLFYAGTLLPELRPAARWRATGLSILLAELDRHVRPDGVYFEQSSYYHRYTADFYTHLVVLARRNDLPLGDRVAERLAALLDHLMYITRPDGRSPLFGDDDGGRLAPLDARPADDFRAALSNGAALFGRADYKFVAGAPAEETLWLLGPEASADLDRLDARPPEHSSRAFRDGGYYVMRDGWRPDSNYMLLDCGPHGALGHAHAHADALSFELAARGRALVLDPGTYTYTASAEERDLFRSSAAHNAVVLGGEPSSVPAGPFSWATAARARTKTWTSHARFDYFEGGHDGYRRLDPPAAVSRSVLFLKGDYFVVRDRVEMRGGARRDCELRFHFAPDAAPRLDAAALRERPAGGAGGLDLLAFGGGSWREERGWVSRCYGAREPAPVFAYRAEAEGAAEFYTFLLPRAAAESEARVRELEATGGRLFEISRAGLAHYDVLLASAGGFVESGRLASDFEWTWARFSADGSALEELVLVNGRRFSLYGREVIRLPNRAPFAVARRDGERLVVQSGDERRVLDLGDQLRPAALRT